MVNIDDTPDISYHVVSYNPSLYKRITWWDFWTEYYVMIYSFLESSYGKPARANVHESQYKVMNDYMAAVIRANQSINHFYRMMVWFYANDPAHDCSLDQYNIFLNQLEKRKLYFGRFYSGTLNLAYAYRILAFYVDEAKKKIRNGLPLHFNAALLEFDGTCTPIASMGREYPPTAYEVIIHKNSLWHVQNYEIRKEIPYTFNGGICDTFWQVELVEV